MRPLLTLIRREFWAYFLSPVGYVTLFFALLINGLLFKQALAGLDRTGSQGIEYPFAALLGNDNFWFIFALIPPLLTMRLLAEERGMGTLEALLTAPIRDWQVVAGKFIGAVLFYCVLWIPTAVYLPILLNMNFTGGVENPNVTVGIDPSYAWGSYVGLFLVGLMFLAIGLFVSSLVKNQLVAAMMSLAVVLVFVAASFVLPLLDANTLPARVVRFLSVPDHFRRDFTRGVIDTRPVVLYLSVTLFCLSLTVRSLETRRLRA